METNQFWTILILIGIIVYQAVIGWRQEERHWTAHSNLMNRFMAKDFQTYVQGEVILQPPKPAEMSEEERLRKIEEATAEKGLPVY